MSARQKEEKKIVSLIRMINLIQQAPGIKPKELAERLGVNERLIYRYKRDLEDANIPIKSDGYGKGYTYAGDFAMYPLDLTEKELMSFTVIPMAIRQLGNQVPKEWLSAYEKIAASLTSSRRDRRRTWQKLSEHILLGTSLSTQLVNAGEQDVDSGAEGRDLGDLLLAIAEQRTIEVVYHTLSRDTINRRKIDPYYLIPKDNRFYVIGYCHLKKEVRTFRFSRFREMTLTKETFQKGTFHLGKYLENVWNIEKKDENVRFVVRFSADISRYVLEEEVAVKPKVTQNEDGSIVMEVTVSSGDEFLRWLMQYGPEAEIVEPQHYREKMRALVGRWSRLYRASL